MANVFRNPFFAAVLFGTMGLSVAKASPLSTCQAQRNQAIAEASATLSTSLQGY